jgi:O-acetylhomoserine/O-acetylserine sulfhydrylase-like pyridoxal-dependent enzyme
MYVCVCLLLSTVLYLTICFLFLLFFNFQINIYNRSDDLIRGICHSSDTSVDEFYIVGGSKGDMTTNEQGEQNDLNEVNAGYQFGAGVENKYRDLWDREESLQPFLRRVSFQKELAPVWTTQWAAMPNLIDATIGSGGVLTKTNAYGMDCVVDSKSKSVFVVGSVLNGAVMTQGDIEMINQGGDDIWVAKVDEKTGNVSLI